MNKTLSLLAGASALFLLTPHAWAVPVDSFNCTFTVHDSNNEQLSNNIMKLDIPRKPRISTTGYQETEGMSWFRTRLSDGWAFGFSINNQHASNGEKGYQQASAQFWMCQPPHPSGKPSGCVVPDPAILSDSSGPYAYWREVNVLNGLPQFDPSEIETIERVTKIGGKQARLKLACEYIGLTE